MRTILYFTIFLVLTGCSGLALKEKIIDNYYLIATDVDEDCGLSYHEPSDGSNYAGIIDATVFSVGYNDKYMIIKQHPRTFPNPPDKKITNYYILPLKKGMDWKNKNGLMGPLSLEKYNEKRKELNIPISLTFIREREDLK